VSDELYLKPGVANFYCPVLLDLLGGRSMESLSPAEHLRFNGNGHAAWKFYWLAGDHHIEHEANGGVPSCVLCGRRLGFVWGDDPGHRR
jgi:hypothetical protein